MPLPSSALLVGSSLALATVVASPASAQEPLFPPRPVGFANDFASVIPAADAARMTRLVQTVQAGPRGEIAIVTLRDIQGRDVGDVAL